jgi:rhamnosyltransferase
MCVRSDENMTGPDKNNTCAIFVTFHPGPEVFGHVDKAAKQVAETVIVDNGSSESCVQELQKIAYELGIYLVLNNHNEGIARALNTGIRWAASRGYLWALTLDQDTAVGPNLVESLADVFWCHPFPQRLAVIGSNYRDKITGKLLSEDVIGTNDSAGREMITVLTSGSLVSIDACQAVGGFRDDFFIDNVDHEFCLRARAHGFLVAMTTKPTMEHTIGRVSEHRLLWKKVGTSNHPPLRQYFLTRNTLILAREYLGKEPRWILAYLWAWVKLVARVCLFEKERIPKIKNIVRGCIDGALGRTSWEPR